MASTLGAVMVLAASSLVLMSPDASAAPAATDPGAPLSPPATSMNFVDVPSTHPFATEITWLADEGITTGYPDGTFRPSTPLTRQALAAFVHRYVGPVPDDACPTAPFVDVPVTHPFCREINWLAEAGLMSGYTDGTFRPGQAATRQAAAAVLHRLADPPAGGDPVCPPTPFSDVGDTHPFCREIAWLASTSIAHGDAGSTFRPGQALTRQAAAAFLHRYDQVDAAPVPSDGCGTSTVGGVTEQRRDLMIGTSPRWFLYTTPTTHDGLTPVPLVLDIHGLAEGATIHTRMSEASSFAEQEGFVVAFPQGRFDPVRWDADDQTDANEDLRFLDTLIESLGRDLCLDLSRVYVMGLSYGAFMTSLLTCTRSETFAAVAPVAGVRAPSPCAQERAVPILAFHGTEDPILPFAPFPHAVTIWANRNGCLAEPTDIVITAEVTRRVYECPEQAAVEFYILPGSGHVWPGSAFSQLIEPVVGYTTMDVHATAEAWAFFERFHL